MIEKLKFLFLVLLVQNCYSELAPPIITSLKVLPDKSVYLKWSFSNMTEIGLMRYKILASVDNWNTSIEWPTQIERVTSYVIDDPYSKLETKSNFECINACLKDANCFYVQKLNNNGENCLLSDQIITNGTENPNAESAKILDYLNEAKIQDLPLNAFYKFKVAVFDRISGEWSNFSTTTNNVDLRLNLNVNLIRTNWQEAKVNLLSNVNAASRLKLNIFMNGTLVQEIIPDSSSLRSYQPSLNYINDDYTNYLTFENKGLCEEACKLSPQCVQFIYFNQDYKSENDEILVKKNSCFLRDNVDIAAGVNVRPEAEAWSIQSVLSEVYLDKLEIGGNYKVQVECTSNYGLITANNQITYSITGLAPSINIMSITANKIIMTWQMQEPLTYTRYAFYYTMNNTDNRTYLLTTSSDYVDANETKLLDLNINKCFEKCFNDSKCLAYTYIKDVCTLKYDLSTPKDCQINGACYIIPKYQQTVTIDDNYYNTLYDYRVYVQTSFGVNSYVSDPRRFTYGQEARIEKIDNFTLHQYSRLRCYDNVVGLEAINWYKNSQLYDPSEDDGEFKDKKSTIHYRNLKSRVSGLYNCEIVLRNGQRLMSKSIYIDVKGDKPSRPNIVSILPLRYGKKDGLLLQWDADLDDPIQCVNLTYYKNHHHTEKLVELKLNFKEICNDTLRSGFLILNKTFDCDTYFMIAVKNSIGYSDFSYMTQFNKDYCIDPPEKIKYYVTEYYTAFFVATIILIVLSLILIGFTTFLMCSKKTKRQRVVDSESINLSTTSLHKRPLN